MERTRRVLVCACLPERWLRPEHGGGIREDAAGGACRKCFNPSGVYVTGVSAFAAKREWHTHSSS